MNGLPLPMIAAPSVVGVSAAPTALPARGSELVGDLDPGDAVVHVDGELVMMQCLVVV